MRWVAIVFLVTGVTAIGQDVVVEQRPEVSGSIETDLVELSNPQFRIREQAARRLSARKGDAVAPLTQLALTGNPEASVRAIDVLRQIYRDGDDETCAAVESSLESLINSDNVGVAVRAETSIHSIGQKWQQRAIDMFVKLGGIIRYSDPNTGEDVVDPEKTDRRIKYAIVNKTWKGGDEGLKYLQRFEDFRTPPDGRRANTLFVIKGSVTKEAITALQGAIPTLLVQERGPACLGITPGNPAEKGLEVAIVKPGTAADIAGLKREDVLLTFDGHEISDFEQLVEKIGEKQPGDKVAVEYQRAGETTKVTVELRGWE